MRDEVICFSRMYPHDCSMVFERKTLVELLVTLPQPRKVPPEVMLLVSLLLSSVRVFPEKVSIS